MTAFRIAMLLLMAAFVWGVLSVLANTPRVAFINPPSYVPESSVVTYYVRVPRHTENRLLIVAAVAEDGVVSEMRRDLAGTHSQALWNVNWRLPAGQLQLIAAVFDSQRQVGRAVHPLTVYSQLP